MEWLVLYSRLCLDVVLTYGLRHMRVKQEEEEELW